MKCADPTANVDADVNGGVQVEADAPNDGGTLPAFPPIPSLPSLPPFLEFVAGPAGAAGETKLCRSPVIGIVIGVHVYPGLYVETGAPLLTLESMKMEIAVAAPSAGRIRAVMAAPGDNVRARQALVEFE